MKLQSFDGPWETPPPGTKRLLFRITDRYSDVCVNLPGVCGQGDTPDSALHDAVQAAYGALASYKDAGVEPPWAEVSDPRGLRSAVIGP